MSRATFTRCEDDYCHELHCSHCGGHHYTGGDAIECDHIHGFHVNAERSDFAFRQRVFCAACSDAPSGETAE